MKDSGPIGLSLMVSIAQILMNFTLNESIKIAKKMKLRTPRSLKIYMDDTFGILKMNKENNSHIEFINILNEIDENVKFTFETETDHTLQSLDTLIIKETNGTLQITVRKQSNTGLTINPSSNQDPKTWIGVFKEALCRAHRLCSNKSLLKNKINYLINNFEDNGYSRKIL